MFWRGSRLLAGKPATGESCCLEMMEAWVRFQERFTSGTEGMGGLDGQTDGVTAARCPSQVAGGKVAGGTGRIPGLTHLSGNAG